MLNNYELSDIVLLKKYNQNDIDFIISVTNRCYYTIVNRILKSNFIDGNQLIIRNRVKLKSAAYTIIQDTIK